MAVEAFVFIECEHSKAREVEQRIAMIAGVKMVKMVTGPYDIIAIVTGSNFQTLGDVVMSKIQATKYVNKTITNVIVE
ncbi:MAG: Lrp/AsnC family transcriptional regulator [Thermodesulfobacteriota bacterium]